MPLAVPNALPLAVLLEFVSEVAGALLVLTGAAAGCLRAWAILRGHTAERVEWVTALGFAFGVTFVILIVVIDLSLELN